MAVVQEKPLAEGHSSHDGRRGLARSSPLFEEVEQRLQKWLRPCPPVCPSARRVAVPVRVAVRPSVHLAAPREERQNFKADKQEVCIIPLVPEEEETRQEKEREGRDGTGRDGRERQVGRQAPCLSSAHELDVFLSFLFSHKNTSTDNESFGVKIKHGV